jgi:hypothetical protein
MVNTQNYVFYFESDIAKVFPFRPTCSSYDSEKKTKSKSEPKRTRKESEQIRTITCRRRSQGLSPSLSLSIIVTLLSMCGTKISQGMTPVRYHLISQKVSQKGPEKKVNKCGKLGLTAWGDLRRFVVLFIWNYHYSTQLNRTKGRN